MSTLQLVDGDARALPRGRNGADDPLMPVGRIRERLHLSLTTFYRLRANKTLPREIAFPEPAIGGRRPRWRLSTIEDYERRRNPERLARLVLLRPELRDELFLTVERTSRKRRRRAREARVGAPPARPKVLHLVEWRRWYRLWSEGVDLRLVAVRLRRLAIALWDEDDEEPAEFYSHLRRASAWLDRATKVTRRQREWIAQALAASEEELRRAPRPRGVGRPPDKPQKHAAVRYLVERRGVSPKDARYLVLRVLDAAPKK